MKVWFLAPAEEELIEASAFYESRVPGLGKDFLDIIETMINELGENPER